MVCDCEYRLTQHFEKEIDGTPKRIVEFYCIKCKEFSEVVRD